MKHLNFVQALETRQGGGLGRAALELHYEWRRLGHGSSLYTTGTASSFDLEHETSIYKRVPPERFYFSPGMLFDASKAVAMSDVIHAHGMYVALNWIFGSQARRDGVPLVYHVHGFFEPWILERSKLKKRLVGALFENANWKQARLWRALTNIEADQIRALGISAPIVVAPNGVDVDYFDQPGGADPKEYKRALFLGRLHPKKGLDLLVQAWSKLGKASKDWELLIVGPDEDNYRAILENILASCAPRPRIRLLGPVQGGEKLRLLKSADLFLLTSYSEGFSVAVLEAMACGRPVLITDRCNFNEVGEIGAGWVCEPTLYSVMEYIKVALSSSDEERQNRGTIGRELVRKKYSWSQVATEINDACKQFS